MNKLALELITEEKKNKTGILDLGKCGLTSLPDELTELSWLKELNLGNHRDYNSTIYDTYKPDSALFDQFTQWNLHSRISKSRLPGTGHHNDFEKADLRKLRALTNLEYLDLVDVNLKYFDFIFDLPALSVLNLAKNTHLALSLDGLVKKRQGRILELNLRALDLSYIEYACDEWDWNLVNKATLEFLNIRGTRFNSWSDLGISAFTALRGFNADHHLPNMEGYDEIGQLKLLEYLDISWLDEDWYEENINYQFLGNLTRLKNLTLRGIRKMKNFDFLAQLKQLEILDMGRLSLKTIPASFSELRNVKELFLGENGLVSCEGLEGLINIEKLHLSYNKLSDLSPLKNLHNLKSLWLHNNELESTETIKYVISLPHLKALYLNDNPLHDIPATFLGDDSFFNCLDPLRSYFKSIAGGYTVRNEIKLVLAGNSTAGKTSLRKLLKGEPVDDHELTTHGIVCDTWRIQLNSDKTNSNAKEMDVHIWDFGGQEYYHATHRLFFTARSVYLLLWEKATNNNGITNTQVYVVDSQGNKQALIKPLEHFPYDYWLESIRQYDEEKNKSPVLLVQNKIDLPGRALYIDQKNLVDKYTNLDFFDLSVLKAAGEDPYYLSTYNQFKKTLQEKLSQISQKKNIGKGLAATREEIENSKNSLTWSYDEYVNRIKKYEPDISNNDIALFTQYFRDEAGVILYYSNNTKLKDTVFLNPVWVIDCIYGILNHTVEENNGIFNQAHVAMTNTSGLSTEKLVELMKSFEVIFEDGENKDLIAPQFLSDECLNKKAISLYKKKFSGIKPSLTVYFPNFLPRSIMLRFLSRFGSKVTGQLYWKNGIAFMKADLMVYVECDNPGRTISIHVEDDDLSLQDVLFNAIYELCHKNNALEVSVDGENFVNIGELISQYSINNQRIQSRQGSTMDINEFSHLVSFVKKPVTTIPSIFVSYAHEDATELTKFRDIQLKSIQLHYAQDLEVCTDGRLEGGMTWDKRIKQFLERATIAIFLISPNFLASEYIKQVEIASALQRFKEKKQIIIPVLIKPAARQLLPFTDKQYLPAGQKPISTWTNKDKAWANVTEGIIQVIDDIKAGKWDDYF